MKIKTADLIGPPLNWVVAKILGHEWRCPWMLEQEGYAGWMIYERAWGNLHPEYSTSGSEVIDIMEREGIGAVTCTNGHEWAAKGAHNYSYGPTLRIAVCRVFVASKLGLEVEVPDVLLEEK